MTNKLRETLPCWAAPTWGDFLEADKYIALEVARACRGGIQPQYWGYPVAWAIPQVLDMNLLTILMAPKQIVVKGQSGASSQGSGAAQPSMPPEVPSGDLLESNTENPGPKNKGKSASAKKRAAAKAKAKATLQELADLKKGKGGGAGGDGGSGGGGKGKGGAKAAGKGKGPPIPAHLRPGEATTPDGKRKCFGYQDGTCDGKPGEQCSRGFWHLCTVPGCNGAHSRLHCRKRQF